MDTLPLFGFDDNTSLPETSGIYKLRCLVTNKFYLGSTSNLSRRQREHVYRLRLNTHDNPKLQAAWNKHGESTFVFEVVEFVLPLFLLEREQYWLDKLQPFDRKGFNIGRKATCPPHALGRKHTPETRAKMSQAQLGNTKNLGKKLSPSRVEQLRQRAIGNHYGLGNKSRIGMKDTPETSARKSVARRGEKKSPEHREKIRQAKLGKKRSPETVEKMRQARLGKPGHKHTPEEIERMRLVARSRERNADGKFV